MDEWLDDLAATLGVAPLRDEEVTDLLAVARDVAHGSERRFAPLSTFLAGVAVAGGAERPEEVARIAATIQAFVEKRTPGD